MIPDGSARDSFDASASNADRSGGDELRLAERLQGDADRVSANKTALALGVGAALLLAGGAAWFFLRGR